MCSLSQTWHGVPASTDGLVQETLAKIEVFQRNSMCVQAVPAGQPAPESLLAAGELSNPVQALMAILGSESSAQEPCLPSSATIRHMLVHTVQLCTGAFARSPTAISTTIKPLTHLALASQLPKAPFPPATSIWVPTGHSTGRALILGTHPAPPQQQHVG